MAEFLAGVAVGVCLGGPVVLCALALCRAAAMSERS